MEFKSASSVDRAAILLHDRWIAPGELDEKIRRKQVLVLRVAGQFAGWLRWSMFWDNTPFLNMLHLQENYRRSGYGTEMMRFWETQMKEAGFHLVLTSTSSAETAQHFYRKLGYIEIGGFTIPGEPLEILFQKIL